MTAIKDTIYFRVIERDDKINGYLDTKSKQVIDRLYKSGKNSLHFERISEKKARSNHQNRYYWKNVLRIICEYVDGMESYAVSRDNGSFDYTMAHRYLTLRFALDNNRDDLINIVKTKYNDKWIEVPMTSFSFDKMKHEDANKYLQWLESTLIKNIGRSFDTVLADERNNI